MILWSLNSFTISLPVNSHVYRQLQRWRHPRDKKQQRKQLSCRNTPGLFEEDKETSVTGVEYVRERINRREGQRGNQGVAKYGRSSMVFLEWDGARGLGGKWGNMSWFMLLLSLLVRVENRLKRGQGQEKENQCGGCCNNPGKVWSGQRNSRGKSEM